MIILITGSREWRDRNAIDATINHFWCLAGDRGEELIVRHGDCWVGADRIARDIVEEMQSLGLEHIEQDRMPAVWQHENCTHPKGTRNGQWYCKIAGHLRNQAMIDKGGIYDVHAYPTPGAKGTADCVRRAWRAGLSVTNHGFPAVRMEDMLHG